MTARAAVNALGWAALALGLALPLAHRGGPDGTGPAAARCTAPGCGAACPWPESWREPEGKILCPAHRREPRTPRPPKGRPPWPSSAI